MPSTFYCIYDAFTQYPIGMAQEMTNGTKTKKYILEKLSFFRFSKHTIYKQLN